MDKAQLNRDNLKNGKTMVHTVVFLGPSLNLKVAREIIPDACFHAPAKCGDIFRVLRLKPKKIVLIDGLFESVPSVWHKEILFAIEKGVAVYGASSMGALRAAELADFGMIGVGKIFTDFYTCKIDNDDAVAVLHTDKADGYRAVNVALVDFQATLEAACEAGAISFVQKEAICHEIKSWFYPERTVKKIALQAKSNPSTFSPFYSWIQEKGLIYQKENDAIEALNYAKTDFAQRKGGKEVARTCFFTSRIKDVNLSLFPDSYDWLPPIENELIALARNEPKLFRNLKETAIALLFCCILAEIDRSSDSRNIERDWFSVGCEWAGSERFDELEKIKWTQFFSEFFGPSELIKLHVLLFLPIAKYIERFFPEIQKDESLNREYQQDIDLEKMLKIGEKLGDKGMAWRVIYYLKAFRTCFRRKYPNTLVDSMSWLSLVYQAVFLEKESSVWATTENL